jgi:hypothetical protein
MRTAAAGLLSIVALAGLVAPRRAHACSFPSPTLHTTDSAMVAVDQTPPVLPQPVVSDIGRGDGEGCISSSKCPASGLVTLTNLATDDMTAAAEIGYRFTVVGGTPPPGFWQPNQAVRGDGLGLNLQWHGGYQDDIDFTIQLVAVDLAGNESAPQMVRIHEDVGGCRIGPGRATGGLTPAIVAFAAAACFLRRRRRRRD